MQHFSIKGYQVAPELANFVREDLLSGLNINEDTFWDSAIHILETFSKQNRVLLDKRVGFQQQIDHFLTHSVVTPDSYQAFLESIGYIEPEPPEFKISTEHVAKEISELFGPQLVVPVNNARFAVNAANARWGSLYDALYGSDVICESEGAERGTHYNPVRGFKVMGYVRQWLDSVLPLNSGSHIESSHYAIIDEALVVTLNDRQHVKLKNAKQLLGYRGQSNQPSSLLFEHHGLKFELKIDAQSEVGKHDKAGIKDVYLESALSTIMDCEDSVAAVDASDKVLVYKNWLQLMQGVLSCRFDKAGKAFTRTLNTDQIFTKPDKSTLTVPALSTLLVRNVGIHITTSMVLDPAGSPVFEGLLDAIITVTAALHRPQKEHIYIVKPKLHGSEEVTFTSRLFEEIEKLLKLEKNTIKLGIMDEERRTSLNLRACIFAARERVIFINTGFLDRTGDEIHSNMKAGIVAPKAQIKNQQWLKAYEARNVAIGLSTGFTGKAQIGKGMWPEPDNLAAMMKSKVAHPLSGASTAWVPSPSAATLHALHYHQVDINQIRQSKAVQKCPDKTELLKLELVTLSNLDQETIQAELNNNIQSILGYVVKWVHQGVGCSKVPDLNHVALMEDRATLRISSQHLANWIYHKVCTLDEVKRLMIKMAYVVDEQNSKQLNYIAFGNSDAAIEKSQAFRAAFALIEQGAESASGYTEPLLYHYRRKFKSMM